MIRIDYSATPKRWQTVELPDENGDLQEARIQYELLDKLDVARYRRDDLDLARSGAAFRSAGEGRASAEEAFLSDLAVRMDEREIAERAETLKARIVGWDFQDPEGNTLECSTEIKAAILRRGDWFPLLWQGLISASEGAGKKPAGSG